MAKKNITEPLMLDSTGIKILSALRQIMISNLPVNDLVTPNATLPLSANMGKVLDGKITAERGVSALYDPTATYAVGDYAIYADALYRCNTAISTPEAFDSTKWDVVDLKNLNDGVLANANSITSLISSLTWKNIVTDQVGTAQIPLPTGWKELLAVIHVYDGSTYKVASASFYILSEMVLGTTTLFRAGHMESSSSSSDICLRVNYDKTWCSLSDAVWNQTEYKNTSKTSVWYR